jgi:hypothetical protein
VAGNLLRDSSECDNLADQILNTVFSRYVGANDISNASDANEVRSIADCRWSFCVSVLLQSPRPPGSRFAYAMGFHGSVCLCQI